VKTSPSICPAGLSQGPRHGQGGVQGNLEALKARTTSEQLATAYNIRDDDSLGKIEVVTQEAGTIAAVSRRFCGGVSARVARSWPTLARFLPRLGPPKAGASVRND
jgi:hypothetical protein